MSSTARALLAKVREQHPDVRIEFTCSVTDPLIIITARISYLIDIVVGRDGGTDYLEKSSDITAVAEGFVVSTLGKRDTAEMREEALEIALGYLGYERAGNPADAPSETNAGHPAPTADTMQPKAAAPPTASAQARVAEVAGAASVPLRGGGGGKRGSRGSAEKKPYANLTQDEREMMGYAVPGMAVKGDVAEQESHLGALREEARAKLPPPVATAAPGDMSNIHQHEQIRRLAEEGVPVAEMLASRKLPEALEELTREQARQLIIDARYQRRVMSEEVSATAASGVS
jgi:hypothetical protein